MNVSLTTELEEFVENKVKTGRYQSASEVIRAGLRLLEEHDESRRHGFVATSVEDLEDKLIAGLDSGSVGKMTDGDWQRLQRRVRTRLRGAKK